MPRKLEWSPPRDAVLCRLRAEGASWDAIASELAISRNAAIERGRRLGARLPPRPAEPAPPDPNRPPLPAGAEGSWGVLVQGTSLEDSAYFWQNPMRHRTDGAGMRAHATTPRPDVIQGEFQ